MDKTKILIVDDHPENIVALSGLIEAADIDIYSAQGADEALNLIVNHDFALALLDVQMPHITGFELARLIRGVKKYRHLPVIFVTAHQRDQSVIFEGYETGAVDLLFKPLDPHVVRSKVRVFVQLDQQSKTLKNQMEQVERLKLEAESANLAKSQFLANMSHEIRTPLAAVLGFSDMMSQDKISAAEKRECVEAIRRNGQLLLRLIDDILDLSKIEAKKLDLEKINFSFDELLKDVESSLAIKATEKGIYLKFVKDPTLHGFYFADPIRLKQVLLNMIGNAIKFTATGGVTAEVTSQTAELSGQEDIVFRIRDTGVGIKEEEAKKLFKPFSQADSSTRRKFGGTGLGLIISRQILNAMGGDIYLEKSSAQEGSVFVVSFKLDKSSAGPAPPAPGGTKEKLDSAALKDKKVLVVDDAKDNRMLIQMYLKSTGLNLTFANDGRQAIAAVKKDFPDLILMDIQMPEMDGIEATREIHKMGYKGSIIALTAHAMPEEHERYRQGGCSQVLTKPIKRQELIKTLNDFFSPPL